MSLGPNSSMGGPLSAGFVGPARPVSHFSELPSGTGLSGPINIVTGAHPDSSVTLKSAKPKQDHNSQLLKGQHCSFSANQNDS